MGFSRLVVLSGLMLVSTLFASFAPFYFELSPRKVQLVSTYSTGLLVGAALTVVIPEGVKAVFDSATGGHGHEHEGVEGWIGASLLGGFILMYMIDSYHGHDTSHHSHVEPHPHPSLRHMPSHLSELEPLSPPRTSSDSASEPSNAEWTIPMNAPPPSPAYQRRNSGPSSSALSTLLGLLLHSLSDGISLGASSLSSDPSSPSSSSSSLSSVIFVAIMLHKAPTAFALSTLLTSASPPSSKQSIRRGLILFSLSAPLGAILTYLLLSFVGGTGEGLEWYTGIALTFSGGTFLFVATHAVTDNDHESDQTNGELEPLGKPLRLGLVLAGMVTPGVLSRFVGHGH